MCSLRPQPRGGSRAGMTLVEMMLGMSLITFLMWGFFTLVEGSVKETGAISAEQAVYQANQVALEKVRKELRISGFATVDGVAYPELFQGNDVGLTYGVFDHDEAVDLGADDPQAVEIVYRIPADDDGDGWPDLDGADVAWSTEIRCLAMVPSGDGETNEVVRLSNEGPTLTLARNVRRFVVEDPEDTGWRIPLSAVRTTLEFEAFDDRSANTVVGTEVIVLKNGGNAP